MSSKIETLMNNWVLEIAGKRGKIEDFMQLAGEDSEPGEKKVLFNLYTDNHKNR